MTGENEHSHDDVFDIHITQSGQGFEISLAALRQALVSGSEEIRFTAPDGFRFGDDRRLHPDTATEHSGHPDDQENTMNNDERYTSEDPEDERATPRLDDTLSQQPPWHTGPEWSGWHSGTTRTGHRAAATNFLNQEDWVGQHAAIAAIAHAVLALSAPVPEEGSWRQRAIEAEAALTAIGGITESPDGIVSRMEKIRRVLSASGQQRILTADERDRLIRMATLIAGPNEITEPASDLAVILPRIRHQLTLTPDERAALMRLEQIVRAGNPPA